jgi:uncharacterized protein YeaO (DUF488 family)
MSVYTKRAYEEVKDSDGVRILVDRVWPRGVSKEKLCIKHWYKNIAPSTELRKWFNHDPKKYKLFNEKYKDELREDPLKKQLLLELKKLVHEHTHVTLVYGAKDKLHNQAEVLKEILSDSKKIM